MKPDVENLIQVRKKAKKVWTANCNISTIGYGIQIIANGDWSYKYGDNRGTKNSGELTLGSEYYAYLYRNKNGNYGFKSF